MPSNNYERHDKDLCACGCGTPVAYEGLEPRFAHGACRTRWMDKWAIQPVPLDNGPQESPPPAVPVPVVEVAAVRAEFAQRVTVAPQVEAVLRQAPSGMRVQSRPGALLRFLMRAARKVR